VPRHAQKKRRTYHHGDLETALLDAADALVTKHGPIGFSLREAARIVGVDPAACYRHFRDRDAVLEALARRGFTRLARALASAAASRDATARHRLVALGRAYIDFALAEPSAFRVMFGPTGRDARDPRLRGDYGDGIGAYERLQVALAAWADAEHMKINIDAASVALWSGVHGLACLFIDGALTTNNDGERRRIIDDMIETLLVGVEHRAK